VVDIDKFTDLTDDINLGGSELYYLDIYVAPRTHFYYTVNIFAPWNSTFYGKS